MAKRAQKVTELSPDDGSGVEEEVEETTTAANDTNTDEVEAGSINLISKADLERRQEKAIELAERRKLPRVPGKSPTIDQAQEWLELLTPEGSSHVSIYVYRLFPRIVRQLADEDANTNIDVLSKESLSLENHTLDSYLKSNHGGGAYKILINDTDIKKNIMDVRVTYPWTEIAPVLNYKELDMTDKKNRVYITHLKNKGILTVDGEIREERGMATIGETRATDTNNTAMKDMVKLVGELATRRGQSVDDTAISKAIELVAESGRNGMQMMREQITGESPDKMLNMVISLATMFKPADQSGMFTAMVGMMQQNQQMFMTMMQAQQESTNKMFQMMLENNKPKERDRDDDDEREAKKSPIESLKEILEIAKEFKGGGRVSEPDTTDKVLGMIERVGVPVFNNVTNFLAARSMQAAQMARTGQQPHVIPQMQHIPQQLPGQQGQHVQANGGYATRGRGPVPINEGPIEAVPVDDINNPINGMEGIESMQQQQLDPEAARKAHIINAIMAYGGTFINAFKNNLDGANFGANVIDMAGLENYLPFKAAGEANLLAYMKEVKPFWNELSMVANEQAIVKFIHEFVNCQELLSEGDTDEDDEEDEEITTASKPTIAAGTVAGARTGRNK